MPKIEIIMRYGESLDEPQKAKALELGKILELLKFLKGMKAISLINDDGQLLTLLTLGENIFPEPNELTMLTVAALAVGGRTSDQLNWGSLEMMCIKSKRGTLILNGAGRHLVLALVFNAEGDLKHLFKEDIAVIERVCQLLSENY